MLGHVLSVLILSCTTSSDLSFTFCGGQAALPAAKPAEPKAFCSSGGGADELPLWQPYLRGDGSAALPEPMLGNGVVCPVLIRAKLRHSETASNCVVSAVVPLICPVAAWSLLTQHWGTSAAWVSFSPRFDQRVMGWGGCLKPGTRCSDCISAG